jgi:hypothetical protein
MNPETIRSESDYFSTSEIRRADHLHMLVSGAYEQAVTPFRPLPETRDFPNSDNPSLIGVIRNCCAHYSTQVQEFGFFPDFVLAVEEDPQRLGHIRLVAAGTPAKP